MAKKKKANPKNDHYYFLGALVVVAVGLIVFAYLMGVQQTLTALQPNLPF